MFSKMYNSRAVLALVLLIVQVGAGAGAEWHAPISTTSFNVESHTYEDVSDKISDWIDSVSDKDPIDLIDYPNPKLQDQDLKMEPASWFMPLLYGRDTYRTNLAFRSDNLYLSAFTNGKGEWFSFKVDKKKDYVIPKSRVLGFKSNYADLAGGGAGTGHQAWRFLIGLEIGRKAVLDAVQVVDNYDPETTPNDVIQKALATLIVVLIEAQRFPYIKRLVYSAWSNDRDGKLDERGARLVANWKRISCALRIWDTRADKNLWDSKEARELAMKPPNGPDIATPEEALGEIWPVLISGKCTE